MNVSPHVGQAADPLPHLRLRTTPHVGQAAAPIEGRAPGVDQERRARRRIPRGLEGPRLFTQDREHPAPPGLPGPGPAPLHRTRLPKQPLHRPPPPEEGPRRRRPHLREPHHPLQRPPPPTPRRLPRHRRHTIDRPGVPHRPRHFVRGAPRVRRRVTRGLGGLVPADRWTNIERQSGEGFRAAREAIQEEAETPPPRDGDRAPRGQSLSAHGSAPTTSLKPYVGPRSRVHAPSSSSAVGPPPSSRRTFLTPRKASCFSTKTQLDCPTPGWTVYGCRRRSGAGSTRRGSVVGVSQKPQSGSINVLC
jgi:hypothetical protein